MRCFFSKCVFMARTGNTMLKLNFHRPIFLDVLVGWFYPVIAFKIYFMFFGPSQPKKNLAMCFYHVTYAFRVNLHYIIT